MVHEMQIDTQVSLDTLIINLNGYLAEKYQDMDESPLSIELLKSVDDTIQYFGENLLLTQKGNLDIITVDLKKTNIVKALILRRVNSKTLNAGNKYLFVFPNPASDYINISSSLPILQTEVYNLVGELMLIKSGPIQRLDTSGLMPGIYVLKVSTPDSSFTKKIQIR